MTRIFITLIIALQFGAAIAQKEDYQWIFNRDPDCTGLEFSESCGATILDFNDNIPSYYKEPTATLDFRITNAVLNDKSGSLLLYTNSMSIHRKGHIPLLGGDTISYGDNWEERKLSWGEPGGFDIGTGAVFIPRPGHEDRYYLLYSNYDGIDSTDYLNKRYADIQVVDGEPILLTKDIVFADSISAVGQLTCAQHANGRDWWLVQNRDDTILTYLIDVEGINLHHKITYPNAWTHLSPGMTKFDPLGEQFAIFHTPATNDSTGNELVLADFDRCTGLLSDIRTLRSESFSSLFGNGVEFSASGRYLYACHPRKIYQYDTWADDVFASEIVVAEYDGFISYSPAGTVENPTAFGRMQIGPDNKIYLSCVGKNFYMHIIHQPDKPGIDCKVQQHAFKLPTYTYGTTPNFPTLRLGPVDDSSCDTLDLDNHPVSRFRYEQDTLDILAVDFIELSYYEPDTWEWDFGDGTNSTERFPVHQFPIPDAYRVCLTVSNHYSTDVSCDTLYLGVSAVDDEIIEKQILLFPNPVDDIVTIDNINYHWKDSQIKFYDISGQLVLQKILSASTQTLDMSGLASGVYIYEIMEKDVTVKWGRVVKM